VVAALPHRHASVFFPDDFPVAIEIEPVADCNLGIPVIGEQRFFKSLTHNSYSIIIVKCHSKNRFLICKLKKLIILLMQISEIQTGMVGKRTAHSDCLNKN